MMDEACARRALREARRDAETELRQLIKDGLGESQQESVQALSAYDNHPADAASDTFEREKDVGLANALRARLKAISRAEMRVREGTYARCAECHGPIGEERLRALPWAHLCIGCQEEAEQAGHSLRTPRTLEEGIVTMPFGQNAEQRKDPVEFDGEDSWQAVARYGTSSTPQDTPQAVHPLGAYVDAAEDHGGVVDSADWVADPDADTPGEAFPALARRPGRSAYDPEDGEPPDRGDL